MHNRAFLELVAAAININASLYPNDSKLEEKVLYELKAMTAKAGTATTLQPSATTVAKVAGGRNV